MTYRSDEEKEKEEEEYKNRRIARILTLIAAFVLIALLVGAIVYFRQELLDLVQFGLNDSVSKAKDVIS